MHFLINVTVIVTQNDRIQVDIYRRSKQLVYVICPLYYCKNK